MEKTTVLALAVTFGLGVSAGQAYSREFVLARGKSPLVTIVAQAEAEPVLEAAIGELAEYMEKASGAKPEVVQDGTSVSGTAIHVGLTERAKSASLPLDGLSREGYVIAPHDDTIFICGATDHGTVHGVYGFLRDCLGIRWFMPGEMWEVVPESDPLGVTVEQRSVNPDFSFRIWSGLVGADGTAWHRRNRLTRSGNIPYYGFGHNLGNIFPPSKYGKDHPEYYSERNGERFVPETDGVVQGEPCFTNPDVIRITIEAVREYFDAKPEATQFSLCINDNDHSCTCSNCAALDSPYQMHRTGKQYSDSYFYYVTEVAKAIAESHPGKTLGVYAYWPVELPPRRIKRLPENVVVCLTQDTSQHFDPAYRDFDRDLYAKWSKVASHMVKYDYYGLGWFSPRYFPHLAADDLKFLKRSGVAGMYCETYAYWIFTAPQLYMAAQLLWDAGQNPDDLLDECMTGLYGDAAPIMKDFYSVLERVWTKERPGRWFQGLDWIGTELVNFDARAMTEAKGLLDRAHAASTGIERERVEYVQKHFRFSYAIVSGYDSALTLKTLPLESLSDAKALVREIGRVLATSERAQRIYATTLKVEPLHKFSYYADGERFWRKFDSWEHEIVKTAVDEVERIGRWSQEALKPDDREELAGEIGEVFSRAKLRNPPDWRARFNAGEGK